MLAFLFSVGLLFIIALFILHNQVLIQDQPTNENLQRRFRVKSSCRVNVLYYQQFHHKEVVKHNKIHNPYLKTYFHSVYFVVKYYSLFH